MLQNENLVILLSPLNKRYLRRAVAGEEMHTSEGILYMNDILAAGYGNIAFSRQGTAFKILRPSLYDLVKGVKRQTQIIYPKDIAYICMRLGVGNGTKVIEAGSGSGALTLALSWFSGEKGHVYTYEAREEFYKLCGQNLAWAGLGSNVTQHNRDIADGFLEKDADALFLDVRTPWEYLDNALGAVKGGGALAFLVPTVDQINKLLTKFEISPVEDVEVVELLLRRWKPVADRLRPDDRMVAHTGFLIFARKQETCVEFDSAKRLGTRERKQEAAKQERLGTAEA